MTAIPKPKRERSLSRLAWCRQQPCLLLKITHKSWCAGPIDAHHVIPEGGGKVGSKVSDFRTVPLCRAAHTDYHEMGRATFEEHYGLNLESEIARLNREYRTLHPSQPKVRKVSMKVKVSVLHCSICGGSHENVPIGKLTFSNKGVTLTCVRRNKELRIA